MKTRTTLSLAIVGAGLFAYIWFVDRHQESTREEAQTSSKVVAIERDKISSLSLKNGATQIELRKKDGVWSMEQPLPDRADSSAIERVLGIVEGLRHDAKIDLTKGKETEMLKEFGVSESEQSLKLKSDAGKEIELLVGKDSAVEGKLYVRLQGQNTVFVIRNELRARLTAAADEYRDHKLSATPSTSVQKFVVKTAEGEVELEKKGGHWDLIKPVRARAADSKINDLLAGVLTAQVGQFLPEAPTPEQGLAEPRATVTLTVEGQKDPVVLQVGAAPSGDENKEKSFAKLSNRNAVTVLQNSALDPLLKARPNDLRDKKLVRIESDIVDRITIQPAGKPEIVLARKGESWVRKEGDKENPVKDGVAAKLLADIQSAETVNFVADLASDLGQYGLTTPQVKVRLSSYASENTAETKAGEKPIATILFGTVEGDSGYAKLEEEPFIVAAPKTLVESIPVQVLDLLPPPAPETVLELKTDDISGILVEPKEQPPVSVEKKDGAWKAAAAEAKLDEPAVLALLGKSTTLSAGKITGTHEPLTTALATPLLKLSFTSKKDGAEVKTQLVIGSALKDGMFPATVSGKEGVFLLNAADKEALERKLLQ